MKVPPGLKLLKAGGFDQSELTKLQEPAEGSNSMSERSWLRTRLGHIVSPRHYARLEEMEEQQNNNSPACSLPNVVDKQWQKRKQLKALHDYLQENPPHKEPPHELRASPNRTRRAYSAGDKQTMELN